MPSTIPVFDPATGTYRFAKQSQQAASGITSLNSLTASVQTLAVGTSGTDFAIVSSGSAHTFNLPTASALNRGALSAADWTAFNAKVDPSALANYLPLAGGTMSGSIILGYSTADRLLSTDASKNVVALDTATYPSLTEISYVKGVTSAIQTQLNAKVAGSIADKQVAHGNGTSIAGSSGFTYDYATGFVGIGTATPAARLNVAGSYSANAWTTSGIGLVFNAATYTDLTGSGTVAAEYVHNVGVPTLASSSSKTITDAFTLNLNAPTNGTNVTITTPWALRVNGRQKITNWLHLENSGANKVLYSMRTFRDASANTILALSAGENNFRQLISSSGYVGASDQSIGWGNNVTVSVVEGGASTSSDTRLARGAAGRLLIGTTSNSTADGTAVMGSLGVGIGNVAPTAKAHVISTTEQLRLGYDSSYYLKTTVASDGTVIFTANTSTASSGVDIYTFRPTTAAALGGVNLVNVRNFSNTSVFRIDESGNATGANFVSSTGLFNSSNGSTTTLRSNLGSTSALTPAVTIDGSGSTAGHGVALTVVDGTTTYVTFGGKQSTLPGFVGIGSSSPTAKLVVAAGSMNDGTYGFQVSGTLSSAAAEQWGMKADFVSGSTSGTAQQNGFEINLSAGYTGSSRTRAVGGLNAAAGTGNNLQLTGSGNAVANFGAQYSATGTTAGANIGMAGNGENGNMSVGVFGKAVVAKNSATNIGVLGIGYNSGTSPVQIGGYFGLNNSTPTFASAALMADNGSTTSDIFVARDNGTAVMKIIDGGNAGFGTASPSARVHAVSTTEQLRVGYDTSNYWNSTVSSVGLNSMDAVGSSPSWSFKTAGTERLKLDSDGATIGSTLSYLIGDANTNGSWRMKLSGADFVIEKREAGVWNTKLTVAA